MGCVKIFCGGRAVASHSGDLGIKRCSNELTEVARGDFALEVTMSVAPGCGARRRRPWRCLHGTGCNHLWSAGGKKPESPQLNGPFHFGVSAKGPTDIGRKCRRLSTHPLEALVLATSPKNAKPKISWKHLVAPSSHETHPSSI